MSQWLRETCLGQVLPQIPSFRHEDNPNRHENGETESFHDEGTVIVDWYSEADAENPHNWPAPKKAFVLVVIGAYSFVVYMAAPIYSPSENAFIDEFGVNHAEASLGLALYVYKYQCSLIINVANHPAV